MSIKNNLQNLKYIVAAICCINLIQCTDQNIDKPVLIKKPIQVTTTKFNKTVLAQVDSFAIVSPDEKNQTLTVDPLVKFQSLDGLGYTLTGGSAQLISRMDETSRQGLLNDFFACNGDGNCISYVRISVGASDLDEAVFTYNDIAPGTTDKDLLQFSIEKSKKDLIPILKKIIQINPSVKILASPWTPPVWMKSNKNSVGGSLLPEYYDTYANYFVKYIEAMKKEGIKIDALTIQNEPENPNNNPSLSMTPEVQRDFIKNNLGPKFKQNSIDTKIILWDHNCDRPQYPITILNDVESAKYVDGSAFHLYAGDEGAMSAVHDAHPSKNLYFTEQWTSSDGKFNEDLIWHTRHVVIGTARNWAKSILEWNLASDVNQNPHTPGGCSKCLGAVTITGNTYTKNVAYYILGQLSKNLPSGSIRIHSSYFESLPNVSFIRPDGKKVLHLLNESSANKSINIKSDKDNFAVSIEPQSIVTIVW